MEVNERNFQSEVLEAAVPVLVDFQAPWCGYCRRLSPALDRLEAELAGRVKVVRVDIDEAPGLAKRYAVETIPTLVLFRNGETVGDTVNPGSQDAVEAWLAEHGAW